MNDLDRLAALAGIEDSYWDILGNFHKTESGSKVSILTAMGFECGSKAAIRGSLKELEERPWRSLLNPVYVVRRNGDNFHVALTLSEASCTNTLSWRVRLEDGTEATGDFRPGGKDIPEKRNIDERYLARLNLPLPGDLPEGYHRLSVKADDWSAEAALIIAPPRAYMPEWLENGERLWGLATHLYSLRSENNWGIGDFSDLADLARISAGFGSEAVGLNPLHALFPAFPDHASPYSPSSRLFLNPLYIDVTAVAEFRDSHKVQALVGTRDFAERLDKARVGDYVDYSGVSAIKHMVLEPMHDFFTEHHSAEDHDDSRRADYDAFVEEGGTSLKRFSLFQALHEHFEGKPWSEWPKDYRQPGSAGIDAFARDNRRRIEYHTYLQWLAARQLAVAASEHSREGMKVGLYMDLAIGADPNGADAWCHPDIIVHGARFGAPPDAFNIQGQDWGMPPLHPDRLRNCAYEPFIATLRANMRHAGALRIDHVMGLLHLYWIPPGEKASNGAYVRYPFDDLLGILALESVRNKCLIIGEDLGTVPDGFRQRMADEGILSYRVLRFERYPDGLFKRPASYPSHSLSTSATHDLSTIKGYWLGRDLKLRKQLGLYDSDRAEKEDDKSYQREKGMLIAALRDQNLLAERFPDGSLTEDEIIRHFTIAVERFLARSPSQLLMLNLDDLLAESEQLNLPGTVNEYPNWRRKCSAPLEALATDPFVGDVVKAVKLER